MADRIATWLATAALLGGCGDEPTASANDEAGTAATSSDAGDVVADDTADGSANNSESTAGSGEGPGEGPSEGGAGDSPAQPGGPDLPFARDIRLSRLTANQGVQVTLVDNGVEVATEDYNTRVIAGRRTLVRGFWSLHADFVPREVVGRLTIDYDDGEQLEQDYTVMVEGDSVDGGASLQWLLEPEDVRPGMRFRARILEADVDFDTGFVSEPPPIVPLAGRGVLGIYDVPLEMRVLLVPVQHEFEGCTQAPDPTRQDVQDMQEQLEQSNPVQRAFVEVGDPMPYTDAIGTSSDPFSPVLVALSAYRDEAATADNVYIYGLLDPCDGFPPGLLGQAIGIPGEALPELANQRISTGRWLGNGLSTSETFVHEVGHTQGRRHVFCSGGEGGIDVDYPHPGGRIGVWGFGIHDFVLRTPTGARDYMSYCDNAWVSDYAWEQTLEVIETLTGWEGQAPSADAKPVLMGSIPVRGEARWWIGRGALDPTLMPSPDHLELLIDGAEVSVTATQQRQPDGRGAITVVAALPTDWTRAETMTLVSPERTRPIVVSTLRATP